MSAKHDITLRSRLRTMEAEDRRYEQLRFMLSTGHGITRIPQRYRDGSLKHRVVTTYRVIYQPQVGAIGTDIAGVDGPDIHTSLGTVRRTHSTTIIPEQTDLMTEISMPHYWALAREKQALAQRLRRYVTGHTWALIPHMSPFGADRFRQFDPVGQAEYITGYNDNRWCNRYYG